MKLQEEVSTQIPPKSGKNFQKTGKKAHFLKRMFDGKTHKNPVDTIFCVYRVCSPQDTIDL
jgi:hypothetical protein